MVRIWNVPVTLLNRQHLLGEHFELHVIVNAIIKLKRGEKGGWQKHPQTLRFVDHLEQLYDRHEQQIAEFKRRGYKHNSPWPLKFYIEEPFKYNYEQLQKDIQILHERNGLSELGEVVYEKNFTALGKFTRWLNEVYPA